MTARRFTIHRALRHLGAAGLLMSVVGGTRLSAPDDPRTEWIDPDTGGPAEDNVPRIEDH